MSCLARPLHNEKGSNYVWKPDYISLHTWCIYIYVHLSGWHSMHALKDCNCNLLSLVYLRPLLYQSLLQRVSNVLRWWKFPPSCSLVETEELIIECELFLACQAHYSRPQLSTWICLQLPGSSTKMHNGLPKYTFYSLMFNCSGPPYTTV